MLNKQHLFFISLLTMTLVSSCNGGSNHNDGSNKSLASTKLGSATNATKQSWSYSYNASGLLETSTGPRGDVTHYSYDNEGNLTNIKNPLGQQIKLSDYTETGNPQTIIDENGITTKLTYDVNGWLLSSTRADAVTTFTYDAIGNVTKVISPDGSELGYTYDEAGRLIGIVGATGGIQYTLDDSGNIINQEVSGNGQITFKQQQVFDEINQLIKIVDVNETRELNYDNGNNLTHDSHFSKSYTWDALNRLISNSTASENSGHISYNYNNNIDVDSPVSITAVDIGAVTKYNYSGLGYLSSLASPDSGTHEYTTDAAGNLISQLNANGDLINYSYDLLNRPIEISYEGSSAQQISFSYDTGKNGVGKLTELSNYATIFNYYSYEVSKLSYSYDVYGNTSSETQTIDGLEYKLNYERDKSGNLTKLSYPDGVTLSLSYSSGELHNITYGNKEIAAIKHLPFGPINQISYGNGVTENIGYNTDYTINSIDLGNIYTRNYKYDPFKNIAEISGVSNYNYDGIYLTNGGGVSIQQIDGEGNPRKSYNFDSKHQSAGQDYQYKNGSNRLTSVVVSDGSNNNGVVYNNFTYDYDAAGNIINKVNNEYDPLLKVVSSKIINSYDYDIQNQLIGVNIDANSVVSYKYNGLSQRILKNHMGIKSQFIYNAQGQLLEEIDGATNSTRDYVYADGTLIAMIENQSNIYYIHMDHNNTPQVVTDQNKAIVWRASYAAFGRATLLKEDIKLNLRADGQYQDDETGLYYNWHRYYDPDLGRYITSDPLGLAAGINTYIYVNGNPINYTDPMGLMGIGGLYDVTVEGGFHTIGAGSNTSGGGGIFINKNGANIGTYTSNGTVVRMPSGIGAQYPSMKGSPELKPINRIYGAYAGRGYGGYITNANCAADLGGAGNAYSLNLPFISLSLGISGDIWMGAFTIGPSIGLSFGSYPTNTDTAEIPIYRKSTK